jgi:hypothetical protein
MTARRRLSPNLDLLSLRSFFLPCSRRARQTRQADAVPVCTATPMADVISIELTTSARSATSGAMDAVARMLETIHLSQHGQMLRVDAGGERAALQAVRQTPPSPGSSPRAQLANLWLKLTTHNKTHSLSRDYF